MKEHFAVAVGVAAMFFAAGWFTYKYKTEGGRNPPKVFEQKAESATVVAEVASPWAAQMTDGTNRQVYLLFSSDGTVTWKVKY